MNTFIKLPYCCGNNLADEQHGFWSDALKRYLLSKPEMGIRIGAQQVTLDNISENNIDGLDYWLRINYVKNPSVKQAVKDVLHALEETGDFEIREINSNSKGRNPKWIFLKSNF